MHHWIIIKEFGKVQWDEFQKSKKPNSQHMQ